MKSFIFIMALFVSLAHAQSQVLTRAQVEKLLGGKELTLGTFERKGSKLLLGEVTGAGKVIDVSKLEVVILSDQAVLKSEIETFDFVPDVSRIGNLDSFRAGGLFYTKEDVKGVIVAK